ncbi:glycosyl hydrolase family 92-domain-containing protein [Mycena epipterygia]|nr:glycosyl hydrolase family 92-domain-containing protein [Mycena epipterygia]
MKALRVVLSAVVVAAAAAQDPAQFVNAFIGTKNGGHVFSGATLPWGSVKPGADSNSGDDQAGYVSDGSKITGISQMHDDGTGGGSSLGNFPFLPLTNTECANNDLTNCTVDLTLRSIGHGDPTASPGYFNIPLNNGVKAELLFLLDVTGDLGKSYQGGGRVTVSPNPTTKGTRVTGSGTFIPSFGQGSYQVYFCFDAPSTFVQAKYYQTNSSLPFSAGSLAYTNLDSTVTFDKEIEKNNPAGVLMGFSPGTAQTLEVRMGISWTSTAKACAYAEAEIPDTSAFDAIHTAARLFARRAKWNTVLGTDEVDATGVSNDTQQLFWSSLYRTYISPTNITGDNPLWNSTEPYWDSFYCIWDTFRWAVRALIDIYRQTGWLPDCRMSLDKGFTQGGSNADLLLSDSFVKGIKAGIDWETGFEAMIKDATVEGDYNVQGRDGIADREKLGFPSHYLIGIIRSASRLLEYAYNDFSIALVAQGLGKTDNMTHYFNKSGDWFNLWNPDAANSGFKGFIQPKNPDGSWYFDPRYDTGKVFRPDHCSPVFGHNDCFSGPGGGEFYEASSWEYSWFVPQDMARLVQAMGGPSTFSSRLDTFFTDGFHDIGDEPGFLPTYLYNYVGQPAKTVDKVDAVLAQYFNSSLNGFPGNDDSGAMSAYVVWSHLGFYPVAGQDTYLLNRPYFPKTTIRNEVTGAVATIIASGLSDQTKYIQSATLNGTAYTKNWISHDLFTTGGTLELVMGSSKSSTWGTGSGDLPMSLSTDGFGFTGEGSGGGSGGDAHSSSSTVHRLSRTFYFSSLLIILQLLIT